VKARLIRVTAARTLRLGAMMLLPQQASAQFAVK
jgi:hypothetical protein